MPAANVDLAQLSENGHVVVEQVVEPPLVAALLDVVREVTGWDVDDPESWEVTQFSPPIWGHQAQWDVRQHPAVHRAFAEIYGQDALIVSQDGLSFKPPVTASAGRVPPALPIHWDLPPTDPRLAMQGVLYLTDVAEDGGAFCCVPGVFRDLQGWVERHPEAATAGGELDLEGHPVVAVPGRAGDLVIFDSRLPHGNGVNRSDRPRVVQYLTMWPVGFWGEPREEHADLYRSGRANPAFRKRPGWDEPQPWPPADLTPLGRRLAGLDPWDA